ncbi:hypothetical protein OKW30_000540 [Paraburkholderia sp. Clong3]|uniref:hypothetical protein n=1 Tax=Paraburkholderia sp. Clong3 TaxID=2991061 RepID=UPI003D199CC0
MNAQKWLKLVCASAVVFACLNAHAQPQAGGSGPAAQAAASSAPTAGEIKATNRQLMRDLRPAHSETHEARDYGPATLQCARITAS